MRQFIIPLAAFGILGVAAQTPPDNFTPNPNIGGGGRTYKDSAHFRVYNGGTSVDTVLKDLEAAYSCFVDNLGWRSTGLSYNGGDTGPFYKMNIYGVSSLGGAAGQMFSDYRSGLSYLKVVTRYITDPKITVHEYGHALAYHEKTWVDQQRTGAWWETVANFVADTYLTSPLCAAARAKHGRPEGGTIIELNKVISNAHQVIVDATANSGNYYQAWPFLTYLTNNPDRVTGLGPNTLRDMFRKYKLRSNETPLHALATVAAPASVQAIVGRYWARMAYLDIGHPKAQELWARSRSTLNYANLDSTGSGSYRVKAARQPKYMGANIIPLKGTGAITARVTASSPFTATLAIRGSNGVVRYVDLVNGVAQATVASGEEASLVVVNTPASLYLYDPFSLSGDVTKGLNYQVQLTGATA